MNKKLYCWGLIASLVIGFGLTAGCSLKNRFERGYVFKKPKNWYKPDNEITVVGTVNKHVGLKNSDDLTVDMLLLKTDSGKEYMVQLGPDWFLKMQPLKVSSGNRVTITGAPVGLDTISGNETASNNDDQLTLLAREIKMIPPQTGTLTLRDKDGNPLWYGKGQRIGQKKYIKQILKQEKPIPIDVK